MLVLAIISTAVGVFVVHIMPKPLPELSRAEFLVEIRSGHLQKITIDGDVITSTSTTRGEFRTSLKPNADQLLKELKDRGIEIEYASPGLIP